MAFRTGTVSWSRFAVTGAAPARIDRDLLDAFAAATLRPSGVGAPPPLDAGWCAGRHVFDEQFAPENVAFGERLLVGLRLDVNRVPAELRRAYRAMAEAARATNEDGSMPRGAGAEARDEAEERCRQELAEGRHRRHRLLPVLWDLERKVVLAPATAEAQVEALCVQFESTTGAQLEPLGSGGLASARSAGRGWRRGLEDARPSKFTAPPPAASDEEAGSDPAVAWASPGAGERDFLGNEMLIWLWQRVLDDAGIVTTANGTVAVVIDRVLDSRCAWEIGGSQALRASGPARLPEARTALRGGKWPRRMGLTLAANGEQWELVLQGDRWQVSAARLPRPDDADVTNDPRALIEHRVDSITALDETLLGLYDTFLEERLGDTGWSSRRESISAWIAGKRPSSAPRREMPIVEVKEAAGAMANGESVPS